MKSAPWLRVLLIIAVGAIVSGMVVAAVASRQEPSFGWFAYAPSADGMFGPEGSVVLSASAVTGLVILAVGLASLAFWAGFTIAARGVRRIS
jgi:hypothetical protein